MDPQTSSKTTYATPHSGNDSKKKTKVLSTKIPLEDYEAYKIFADEMFDGSIRIEQCFPSSCVTTAYAEFWVLTNLIKGP